MIDRRRVQVVGHHKIAACVELALKSGELLLSGIVVQVNPVLHVDVPHDGVDVHVAQYLAGPRIDVAVGRAEEQAVHAELGADRVAGNGELLGDLGDGESVEARMR